MSIEDDYQKAISEYEKADKAFKAAKAKWEAAYTRAVEMVSERNKGLPDGFYVDRESSNPFVNFTIYMKSNGGWYQYSGVHFEDIQWLEEGYPFDVHVVPLGEVTVDG